ncbi:MAG: DNA (cytosine-5-)-methyltransferase [Gammaproteobacteria bacterium]|nr:DNA (cytosine-5-)-methyltransferase [Gammaproteobacteria bacterium]NNJ84011.1 DNA (cytosine-5-)-methyltransferase [Gammaproteobacteria bacterium]
MPGKNSGSTKPPIRLKIQQQIFEFAVDEGIELADALKHHGYDFDDLVYEESHQWDVPRPKPLIDYKTKASGIPLVSFFTGCGGMDIGFEAAGYKHIAAFEFNELFCKTLRKNRPNWKVFGPPTHSGDVSNIAEVIETLEEIVPPNFNGVFAGGPPCQPFSIASNQRFHKSGENFKRIGFKNETDGNLLFDYVNIVKHFRPTCFLIENVPGLRDLDGGEQLSEAIKELINVGYKVDSPLVLNAADFGVPQFRERLFVIGSRNGKSPTYPAPMEMHFGSGSVLSRNQGKANNTETRIHKLNSVQRYCGLDYGQRDQLGRVDRLNPRIPSKTVIAGGTNGGGRSHLHPEIPRTLSVRECARLQTFPDEYTFVGSTARQFTQVGNAVPPVLAAQLGLAIASSVFRAS